MLRLLALIFGVLALFGCTPERTTRAPLVLAAASLQESMNAAADAWAAEGHERPIISFAASSALARQIQNGAEADLFISADQRWMDSVARMGLIQPDTRRNLVGNAIVLIAPVHDARPVPLESAALKRVLGRGRLAIADPDSVPAGRYGKAALENLGLWAALEDRLARAENVRAALALVERGEAPLGIVYATDAQASDRVRVVAGFPAASHPPIDYPVALLPGAGSEAGGFHRFILSARGQAIFAALGFTRPTTR